jgi:hypothetical protein
MAAGVDAARAATAHRIVLSISTFLARGGGPPGVSFVERTGVDRVVDLAA